MDTTLDMLLTILQKDTSRLDVMQEVAKIYYYQRNYKLSYSYYMPFYATRKAYNLDIYRGENIKIGKVFLEMNMKNEARQVLEDFKRLADNDQTVYKDMYYAQYFALENDFEQTIECLNRFSSQPNFHYWTVLFTSIDPVFEKISDRKEFKLVMKKIENNFRKYHHEIRKSLKEKDLL